MKLDLLLKLKIALLALIALLSPHNLGGANSNSSIASNEDAYYAQYGKYQYVAPTTKGATTTSVTEYTSPKGVGYQIVEKSANMTISTGYGSEALERTYMLSTASSTPK